ncbi:MAG: carboxypeptidase regulatory-like domain-containing protein [Bacteroidota bacterium]
MTKDQLLGTRPLYLFVAVTFGLSTFTTSAQNTYKEIEVKDGGTVTGVVRFVGASPDLPQFDVTKNPEQCGHKKQFDRLILGKNNGVKNAVVSLEGITEGKKFAINVMYTINQKNCEYIPHVAIVPIGAQLQIVNSDNILHNVHAYTYGKEVRTVCNIAQPIKGQCTILKQSQLDKAGVILTTCDAGHPWMTGNLILCEHPYYTLTDNNGKFTLTDVPSGTYRIKMWHEGFKITGTETENSKVKRYHFEDPYEVVKEVTLPDKGKAVVSFEFSSRLENVN